MRITFTHQGDFSRTTSFLNKMRGKDFRTILDKYGQLGVDALAANTPVDTGRTAASWSYSISGDKKHYTIEWRNSNIQNGVNIAIILQYGHGTNRGGYVKGRDYINPAIQPIFDKISKEAWEEVKNA